MRCRTWAIGAGWGQRVTGAVPGTRPTGLGAVGQGTGPAREAAGRDRRELAAGEDEGLDGDLPLLGLDHVQAACFAAALRPRLAEPGGDHHRNAALAREADLELTPLARGGLVDVPREDQLGACVDERSEDVPASRHGPLARPPGCPGQVVVQADDAERARLGLGEPLLRAFERSPVQTARLVPPRSGRVQPDDVKLRRPEYGLRRPPLLLELAPGMREARRKRMRDVVVAGHGEHGRPEAAEEGRGALVLAGAATVGEVARDDDQLRLQPPYELAQRRLDRPLLVPSDVQVGDVNQLRSHDRSTLYTHRMTEPTELFDDLYLGLRAGGAIRKRRRGELLTSEEEAALGRWQRLSQWRKTIAIGAFAVGTFGLGFTLGGIVFSRRGKREAV